MSPKQLSPRTQTEFDTLVVLLEQIEAGYGTAQLQDEADRAFGRCLAEARITRRRQES